jgi:hypothetical protein
MNYTKRCFESVGALGRHNQVVLRQLLGNFPEYVAALGLDLSASELDLERVRAAFAFISSLAAARSDRDLRG